MNKSKELRIGAIIAYLTIAINIVSGLFFTPWIIEQIGDSDYGLYTLANSVINLFMFDFGLSAATSRFVSKYLAENRQDKVNQILGTIYKLYFMIDMFICIVFIGGVFSLEQIYTNLTPFEIHRFKVVFIISAIFAIINFPCVTFTGILNSYEKFIALKFSDAIYRILNVLFTVVALLCNGGLYALVLVQVAVGILILTYKFYVIKTKTPIKVTFSLRGKGMYKSLFGFSIWITISTLSQRLILGITPSILGVVSNTTSIAVFGIVSVVENYIHLITTALNGMFVPQISRIFIEKNYSIKLNNLIVKVGKFQFALHGLIIAGFLVLGKEFIYLWLDESYQVSYYCILLVTIPNLFYYSLQIANSAMMIQNNVKVQAITNLIVGIINVMLSFIWSKEYGILGACIAIFVAYNIRNIGYLIGYKKYLKINIKKICRECYLPMGICIAITVVVGNGINYYISNINWMSFVVKIIIIVILYLVLIFMIGINKNERKQFKNK